MPTLTERHLKIPKYLQLAEQLRQQIESGTLQPNDRLPSFPQLRAQHGVTNSTVEKVYSLLERDGLIERQPSRGTFVASRKIEPDASRKSAHATIGISGLGFTFAGYSSYYGRMLRGVQKTTQYEQDQLMLLDHNSLKGWGKIDGVLLCDYVAVDVLHSLPEGLPRAFLVAPLPGMAGVSADDYSGGRQATEHLLELGHRVISYLHSPDPVLIPQRLAGYRDALQSAGVQARPDWTHCLLRSAALTYDYGADFVRVGRESMREWLRAGWKELGSTAILAHNDEVALGVIEALREAGLKIPNDVSVVGFDGTEVGIYSTPRLTTIEVPLQRIGVAATEMLLDQIRGQALAGRPVEHRVLPVHLKVRESTAPPPRIP
jgi:DNA-binding LacI/PurR family transcriptional regulator